MRTARNVPTPWLCGQGKAVREETQFHMPDCDSVVGRLTYTCVFCDTPSGTFEEKLGFLIATLLDGFPRRKVYCSNDPTTGTGALSINELERHAFIQDYPKSYIILPDTMDQVVDSMLNTRLMRACDILEKARLELAHEENTTKTLSNFNRPQALQRALQQLADVFAVQTLDTVVFDNGIYSSSFRQAKRAFFDALYLLYILRRRVRVNLEHVIRGLRILHILEALATDIILNRYNKNSSRPADKRVVSSLEDAFPALAAWDGKTEIEGIPLIQKATDLDDYLSATPVVHPMFARLFYYTQPFNDITPIGIGDLKVVKQWLRAYVPGEISHIHNVLKGELKERTHRRLEKTEETFSFVSEQQEESTKETQSTDRFEMKRDAETVIKTDLNLTSNVNLQYQGGPILLTVGAGMAYSQSQSDTKKTSDNFWHEVVSKTLTRVQTRVTQQRSVTKIFETEETNKQSFHNVGERNVSGIYRWLDKKYSAQLFNYGKRLMFEFIIPEPAAFYVESKVRHYEATLDCPQTPQTPDYPILEFPFKPDDYDSEEKFFETF